MKTEPIRHLLVIALLIAALRFSPPAFGQDTTDMLSKSLDLVHQVENPAGNPPTDAQRIDLLTQAIKMAQEAPNHRLKGHRVLAIQAIRNAITEIRSGDPNHQAAPDLQTADTELTTSISLAGNSPAPAQAPTAAPTAPPTIPPPTMAAPTPPPSSDASPAPSPSTLPPADLASITEVITRLVTNASQKPPGPVEQDVTDEMVQTCKGLIEFTHDKISTDDAIARDFNTFTLESPFTSLYSDASAALVYGKVKLTQAALKSYKDDPDVSTVETTLNGKVVSTASGPTVVFGAGGADFIDAKVPDDGQVIASLCLVRQHDHWKVHCLYFSNDPIEGDNKDFIVRQLADFAKKMNEPAGVAGHTPPSSAPAGPTPDYTILHNFADGTVPQDGQNPCTSLVQGPDGNLYGVTRNIDSKTTGNLTIDTQGKLAAIYEMTPQGKVTILRSFDAGNADDDPLPDTSLTLGPDGTLYGTMSGGGQYHCGTVFKITGQGAFSIVYEFGKPDVKDDPRGASTPLINGADGNLYGTSYFGGSAEQGAVFKITPQGAVTTLHSFLDGSVPHDGDSPRAPLVLGPDGNYYGTTFNGSGDPQKPDFKGTLFKITPSGALTILHRFADGSIPNDGKASDKVGLFVARDHTLYGTTEHGGNNIESGTFFKFTPEGAVTILHVFNRNFLDKDGVWPQPTLVEGPNGNFYGTTNAGGSVNTGTIFKITPAGTVTILHSFGDGTIPHDGTRPEGGLVLAGDGNFYGTTSEGGSAGKGIVFRIKVP